MGYSTGMAGCSGKMAQEQENRASQRRSWQRDGGLLMGGPRDWVGVDCTLLCNENDKRAQ